VARLLDSGQPIYIDCGSTAAMEELMDRVSQGHALSWADLSSLRCKPQPAGEERLLSHSTLVPPHSSPASAVTAPVSTMRVQPAQTSAICPTKGTSPRSLAIEDPHNNAWQAVLAVPGADTPRQRLPLLWPPQALPRAASQERSELGRDTRSKIASGPTLSQQGAPTATLISKLSNCKHVACVAARVSPPSRPYAPTASSTSSTGAVTKHPSRWKPAESLQRVAFHPVQNSFSFPLKLQPLRAMRSARGEQHDAEVGGSPRRMSPEEPTVSAEALGCWLQIGRGPGCGRERRWQTSPVAHEAKALLGASSLLHEASPTASTHDDVLTSHSEASQSRRRAGLEVDSTYDWSHLGHGAAVPPRHTHKEVAFLGYEYEKKPFAQLPLSARDFVRSHVVSQERIHTLQASSLQQPADISLGSVVRDFANMSHLEHVRLARAMRRVPIAAARGISPLQDVVLAGYPPFMRETIGLSREPC